MFVTFCEYEIRANAPFTFKVCVRNSRTNFVYQSNYLCDIHNILKTLNISIIGANFTTKKHRNYLGELVCTQTIYYIKEV